MPSCPSSRPRRSSLRSIPICTRRSSARTRARFRSRSCSRRSTVPIFPARSSWRAGQGTAHRYRARFWSTDAARLRDLFEIVGPSHATEVLIDDRPVPYARELWLPLVWFLIT
jgi:hypothetical protein